MSNTGLAGSGGTGTAISGGAFVTDATGSYSYVITPNWYGGSGGSISVSGEVVTKKDGTVKRIGPKLFFSYVKSKLNKTEKKKLKIRMSKLQALVKNAEEMGQQGLFEEFAKMLAVVARESEAIACGYDTWINKTDIEKFMGQVTENDGTRQKIVFFKKLQEFPRAIPKDIQKVIKDANKKGVFDELWVLYLDYTGEEIKTNKEKIRQKDPILFGRFSYDPNKFFYLADWIDDYCDLTLNKFVDTLKKDDPEYNVGTVDEMDAAFVERIKKEVKARHERLTNTNPSNFRNLMTEEDKKTQPPVPKKRWYEVWKRNQQ